VKDTIDPGKLQRLLDKIGGERGVDKILEGKSVVVKKSTEKLEVKTTLKVPARERFVAREHFKIDTSEKAAVRIFDIDEEFERFLLGLVEEKVPRAKLTAYKILQRMLHPGIVAQFHDRVHTVALAHVWYALTLQHDGRQGVLAVDGHENVIYVNDVQGIRRPVILSFEEGLNGWDICSEPFRSEDPRSAGHQVIAR
jgi:hypothetical protein